MSKKASQKESTNNILQALKEAQAKSDYITPEFAAELAESCSVPVSDIYGVASFYSFLATEPSGRNTIRICQSLPCHLKDGQAVIDAVAKETGIKPGNVTPDSRFSFHLTNCIGLCDGAPAMLVNHDVYTDLTPGKIAGILKKYQ